MSSNMQRGFQMTPWPDTPSARRPLPYRQETSFQVPPTQEPIARERMSDLRPAATPSCDVHLLANTAGQCVPSREVRDRLQSSVIHDTHLSHSRPERDDRLAEFLVPGSVSLDPNTKIVHPFMDGLGKEQGKGGGPKSVNANHARSFSPPVVAPPVNLAWQEAKCHPSTCQIDQAFAVSSQERLDKIKEINDKRQKGLPASPYDGIPVSSPFLDEGAEQSLANPTLSSLRNTSQPSPSVQKRLERSKKFEGTFHEQQMREQESKKRDPRKEFMPNPDMFKKGVTPHKPK